METGLINELTQDIDLANQLKRNLVSPETSEFLVEKILSSYEKALSMVTFDHREDCNKNALKKRKTMAKWSKQVKVCSGNLVEALVGDGYSWRKYGQKNILAANHPRAYYRCTHRNVQGCLATRQVQRSDEDTSVFQVTYRGKHTCIQATHKKPKKQEESIHESKPICLDRVFIFNVREEGLFPSFSLDNLFYLGCDSTRNLQTSDSDPTNSPFVDWDHVNFDANFLFDITDSEMFV